MTRVGGVIGQMVAADLDATIARALVASERWRWAPGQMAVSELWIDRGRREHERSALAQARPKRPKRRKGRRR